MKRQHLIEKLVAANYADERLLVGLNNFHLQRLYNLVYPRILMMSERNRRRSLRVQRELEAERRFRIWEAERCKNWVHPKVQYPLTGPGKPETAKLDFGLNDFKETAAWLAKYNGDPDALATLRRIAGKQRPEEDYDTRRQNQRRRNNTRRFRRIGRSGIQKQPKPQFARV